MSRHELLPEPLAWVAETYGAPGLTLQDRGPHHWKCVALTGLEIARLEPAVDLYVVYVFAQLHDSQRLNEYTDPEHGPRAAEIASQAIDRGGIAGIAPGDERASKLIDAIHGHTTGRSSDDVTIGACWDADRVNLWRVGTVPDIAFISTRAARARFDVLSPSAKARIEQAETTWTAVAEALELPQP